MHQPIANQSFQVVTWNVNFRRAEVLDALVRFQIVPDILTLQEVTLGQADRFRERLAEIGLPYGFYAGRTAATEKRYGNFIASRWRLEPIAGDKCQAPFPWQQLVARAVIDVNGTLVSVITVHVPNAAANGWAKVDTLRALANVVRETQGAHCLLTGDFNEPQFVLQDNRIVSFGQQLADNGQYVCWDSWSFAGRAGAGSKWDEAVRWFFESRDEHGLRHAFWDAAGAVTIEPTHLSRGKPRWFDHLFVSEGFAVEACEYLHDLRLQGYSDHSALRARIAFR